MKINLKKFKKVKSTNDIAIKLIKRNISEPTLVLSEKQTNRFVQRYKRATEKISTIIYAIEKINET